MSTDGGSRVSELLPAQAWDLLKSNPYTVLIDVRTKAEWAYVGVPDVSSLNQEVHCIEWASYPGMSPNPHFVAEVSKIVEGGQLSGVLFLCRSGVRSMSAAVAVSEALTARGPSVECINVIGGFEGDLDAKKHRGGLNGWKAHKLPWRQS